jgi:hypothetical protein
MGPPPPADISGEHGIALTRKALRLFLPCVFGRSARIASSGKTHVDAVRLIVGFRRFRPRGS